ncbi:hypothetical protein [Streptomyces sp. NPDC127038]|uniref:hypothetical protein n=1 Tax=Streptomyces sp. NPDC127038 TaxID=3347114 RepID=UPI00365924DC
MTETLHAPARSYGAHSPLAYLLNLAGEAAQVSDQEQREEAETAVIHHLSRSYPYSLAQAIDVMAWQGYPAVRGPRGVICEASAVAWLDGGLWLHHTVRSIESDGALDVLTLIVPCTCGRGYTDITLDSEDMLMELLTELRPTHGQSVHNGALLDCAIVPAAAQIIDL